MSENQDRDHWINIESRTIIFEGTITRSHQKLTYFDQIWNPGDDQIMNIEFLRPLSKTVVVIRSRHWFDISFLTWSNLLVSSENLFCIVSYFSLISRILFSTNFCSAVNFLITFIFSFFSARSFSAFWLSAINSKTAFSSSLSLNLLKSVSQFSDSSSIYL